MIISERLLKAIIQRGAISLAPLLSSMNQLERNQRSWTRDNATLLAGLIVSVLEDREIAKRVAEPLAELVSDDEELNEFLFGHDIRLEGTRGEENFEAGK